MFLKLSAGQADETTLDGGRLTVTANGPISLAWGVGPASVIFAAGSGIVVRDLAVDPDAERLIVTSTAPDAIRVSITQTPERP